MVLCSCRFRSSRLERCYVTDRFSLSLFCSLYIVGFSRCIRCVCVCVCAGWLCIFFPFRSFLPPLALSCSHSCAHFVHTYNSLFPVVPRVNVRTANGARRRRNENRERERERESDDRNQREWWTRRGNWSWVEQHKREIKKEKRERKRQFVDLKCYSHLLPTQN